MNDNLKPYLTWLGFFCLGAALILLGRYLGLKAAGKLFKEVYHVTEEETDEEAAAGEV